MIDTTQLTQEERDQIAKLKSLQGTRSWTSLFKELDSGSVGKKLRSAVLGTKQKTGKFTLIDAALLAQDSGIPIATLFRMIEAPGLVPTGTWERAKNNGMTAKSLLEEAKKRR